jgi:hypothetical protein
VELRIIARQFDQPASMSRENWLLPLRPMGLQPGQDVPF